MIYNNDFLLPLTLEFYHKRLIISAQMAPNKPIILTCDQIKHVSEEGSLGTKIVNVVTSRQTDRRVNFFPNGSEHREYFF